MSDPMSEAGPGEIIPDDAMAALSNAGRDAGEYLLSIGQTDVAKLTRAQWVRFLATIALAYEDFRKAERGGLA